MNETEQRLTIGELARTLKVSVPAIRVWTKQGLPHEKFGRLVRFRMTAELLDWLRRRGSKGKTL